MLSRTFTETVSKTKTNTLSINHPKYLQARREFGTNERQHQRMVAGSEKYGFSWAEVDLRTDIEEELDDVMNYLVLMFLRLDSTTKDNISGTRNMYLLKLLSTYVRLAQDALERLPKFEGPTSAEWVEQQSVEAV